MRWRSLDLCNMLIQLQSSRNFADDFLFLRGTYQCNFSHKLSRLALYSNFYWVFASVCVSVMIRLHKLYLQSSGFSARKSVYSYSLSKTGQNLYTDNLSTLLFTEPETELLLKTDVHVGMMMTFWGIANLPNMYYGFSNIPSESIEEKLSCLKPFWFALTAS